jgi:putative resolvase
MSLLPSRKASKILGVTANTLRTWDKKNKIKTIRTPSGQRLYDVNAFIKEKECKSEKCKNGQKIICYARVSTKKQNKDLERQTKRLTKKYPKAKIITEIASGLNYKRKGLQTILEQAMSGDSIKLVVTYKDRLARFGFELIQYIIERNGGSIVVLKNHKLSPQQELTEDMLSVMHSFSSKLYGMRKFKRIKM